MQSFLTLKWIRIIFILSGIVLAGSFLYMFIQVKNLIDSSDNLNHASLVENTLQNISSDISYAETSQRGFLLTGDSIHLLRRDTAFSRLPGNLLLLDSLLKDNQLQEKNLIHLKNSLQYKYRIMQDVMQMIAVQGLSERVRDSIRAASVSMEIVKTSISQVLSTEKAQLERKKIRYSRLSFLTPLLAIVLFILAFILQVFSYTRLSASVKTSEKLKEELYNEKNIAETILNSSLDMIAMYDTQKRILYYGKATEKVFGSDRKKVIGRSIEEVLPAVIGSKGMQDLERAIKGEIIHNEIYFSPVTNRYFENFLTPLRNEEGEVYGVIVVAHDNTDLINFSNLTSQHNKALEEAQRLAKVGSWEWNTATDMMILSSYMQQLYDLDNVPEIPFTKFTENIHPADRAFVADSLKRAVKTKTGFDIQYRLVTGERTMRYLQTKGECEPDAEGKVARVLGSTQDITQRVENEELLRQSQEKFNKLFQLSPFSISLSDMNGRFIDINENFIRTFGFSREELIGKTSAEINLLDAEMRNRIMDELRITGTIKNIEIEVKKKNGQLLPVLVSIERITIGDQRYYLNAINDIAERKKAEEKIEQANQRLQRMNKELESFAYVSSHDLQEPLRKIQTFSGRLMEKEIANLSESGLDQFRRIQKAAHRMQTLIEDLLSYSRASTELKQYEITDLHKLAQETAEEFKDEIRQNGGTIYIGSMCEVPVISFQFRQLLQNLISNSVKFADPDRPLRIEINGKIEKADHLYPEFTPGEEICHVQLKDNGIGFEKEFNEKVFEVFQRLHGRDKYKGTGIGLAIVKKIVENHNGLIKARGELGKGSCFDIYFPADLPV